MTSRATERLRRRRPSGEEGMTLMELMIGMVIMTILLTICTSAVVSMFSSTGKTQAVQNSAQQLDTAFDRLDRQVRYASTIDQPTGSATTNDLSVAFQTAGQTSSTCTQLRVRPVSGSTQQQLVERTWTVTSGSTAAGNISGWSQLALGVSLTDQNGNAVTPFAVSIPTGGSVQQLRLRLVALDGSGRTPTKSFSEIVFSALNSSAAATASLNGSLTSACAQPGIS